MGRVLSTSASARQMAIMMRKVGSPVDEKASEVPHRLRRWRAGLMRIGLGPPNGLDDAKSNFSGRKACQVPHRLRRWRTGVVRIGLGPPNGREDSEGDVSCAARNVQMLHPRKGLQLRHQPVFYPLWTSNASTAVCTPTLDHASQHSSLCTHPGLHMPAQQLVRSPWTSPASTAVCAPALDCEGGALILCCPVAKTSAGEPSIDREQLAREQLAQQTFESSRGGPCPHSRGPFNDRYPFRYL